MPSLTAEQEAQWSDSRQLVILGVCILILVLGNISVPLRVWGQQRLHKGILLEDYCLVVGLLFANVVSISTLVARHYGFGVHVWRAETMDPTTQNMPTIFFCIWLTAIFNGPCLVAIKLGLLFFYRRLFLIKQRWLQIAWWINLVYAVLWALGSTFFYIFQCKLIQYYWERVNPHSGIVNRSCDSAVTTAAIPLIFSIVSDFGIFLLPVTTVATLQMPFLRKVGVTAIFGVGIVALVSALTRLIVLEVNTHFSTDPTYGAVAFELLNVVELNLGILCACAIPIASPLRARFLSSPDKTTIQTPSYAMEPSAASTHHRSYRQLRHLPTGSTERFFDDSTELVTKPTATVPGGWDGRTSGGIVVKTEVDISRG